MTRYESFIDVHPYKAGWYWMWPIYLEIFSYKPHLYYVYEGEETWMAKTFIDDGIEVSIALDGYASNWFGPIEFTEDILKEEERIPKWYPLVNHGQTVTAWDEDCKEETIIHGEYITYICETGQHLIRIDDGTYCCCDCCVIRKPEKANDEPQK